MEKPKLGYSLKEAAEVSSLSRRTLEYLIEQGKLRAVKINTRTVIPALALEKLMEINEAHRIKVEEGWQLRETQTAYRGRFEGQKAALGPENTFDWDQSLYLTVS